MKKALKSDWNITAMPDDYSVFKIHRIFDNQRMELIKNGLIPFSMDDKWFIYFEEKTLHFHRSWTGICIYEAIFYVTEEGNFRVKECRVNNTLNNGNPFDSITNVDLISALIDDVIALNKTEQLTFDDG